MKFWFILLDRVALRNPSTFPLDPRLIDAQASSSRLIGLYFITLTNLGELNTLSQSQALSRLMLRDVEAVPHEVVESLYPRGFAATSVFP